MNEQSAGKMKRREFMAGLGAGAAAVALRGSFAAASSTSTKSTPSSAPAAPSAKRPNVIIVVNDMLRSIALGPYGGTNITTPNLDQMARDGILFSNAVSTCPLCTPFRGQLMTGRYPTHSGIVVNNIRPGLKQRCIAHVFNDAGYRTGLIGKWHLYAPRSSTFVPPSHRLGFQHWEAYNFEQTFMQTPYCSGDSPKVLSMNGYEMDAETDMAMHFISECKSAAKPFFLVVSPHPPHSPRNAANTPKGCIDKVPETLSYPPDRGSEKKDGVKPAQSDRYYYAMIKNADDNMGRLLQFLDKEGLAKDTIVVYTSDHGDMLGSKGLGGKNYPYIESVRIPMIARWPGHIPPGVKTDALHTPLDHLTTLCGLIGLEAPKTADGADLSAVMLGKGDSPREAVLMANYSSSMAGFRTLEPKEEWRAVKTRRFTYAKWLTGKEELYDDQADFYQMRDLSKDPAHAADLKDLRARLAKLMAEAHDVFLPGTAYANWYDKQMNLVATGLGPVA